MKKLNIIKWILARFNRKCDTDHVVEVVVYLDGRVIKDEEHHISEDCMKGSLRYNAFNLANGVISFAVAMERRRMKGRA